MRNVNKNNSAMRTMAILHLCARHSQPASQPDNGASAMGAANGRASCMRTRRSRHYLAAPAVLAAHGLEWAAEQSLGRLMTHMIASSSVSSTPSIVVVGSSSTGSVGTLS